MANLNDQISDMQIANQHLIERYKDEIIGLLLMFFKRMEKLVKKEITNLYDEENLTQANKKILLKRIRDIQKIEMHKIEKRLFDELDKFVGQESSRYYNQLKALTIQVSDFIKVKNGDLKTIKKSVEKDKIVLNTKEVFTVLALWGTLVDSINTRMEQNIESAYILNKTTRDVTQDVSGGYKTNESQLGAVIAVLIQHAYIKSISGINKVNDFINGYQWVATLDSRTSDLCISLDGKVWYPSKPSLSTLPYEIYPPAHYRCRSTTTPITMQYGSLGIKEEELSKEQKDLLSGIIPSRETYASWFERQPSKIKKEILGAVRYSAYINGSVDFTQFYKSNGSKLTLKELAKKQAIFSEEYLSYVL